MGEKITLTAEDGHTLGGYRADPTREARGGIVICQEIFGVNEHIRGVVDRFAEEGYSVIAPALFDRVERDLELAYDDDGIAKGRALKDKVALEDSLLDIKAAAAELPGGIAVVGYCWGGTLAWLAATRLSGIACSVCYYGGGIHEFREEHPRCPVMMHFGEEDAAISMEDVDDIRELQFEIPIFTYPKAGHGFNCEMRGSYHPDSAASAHQRTIGLINSVVR